MDKLLENWNLSHLEPEFKKHRLEPHLLKYITDEEIKELCPLIGDRIQLRMKLREELRPCTKGQEILLKALNESAKGRDVLDFYNKHKHITATHRENIVASVVDFCIKKYGRMSTRDFENLAEQIEKHFLGELKETYFTYGYVRSGKRMHSKKNLLAQYYNAKRHERRPGRIHTCLRDKPKTESRKLFFNKCANNDNFFKAKEHSFLNLDEAARREAEETRIALAETKIKTKDVEENWVATFSLRREQFVEANADTIELLKQWPSISLTFGHELIDLDFETLYPGKNKNIFEKWPFFKQKIIEKYQKETKHDNYLDLLLAEDSEISADFQDFIIISNLSRILRPYLKVKSKYSSSKISIAESKDAFIIHVKKLSEVKDAVKPKETVKGTKGQRVQPIIIAVGEDLEIVAYFVVFDTIEYRFKSILSAINSCFQLHQILHLSYNEKCAQIWMFIQEYFYEIYTPWDIKLANVTSLCKELREASSNQ